MNKKRAQVILIIGLLISILTSLYFVNIGTLSLGLIVEVSIPIVPFLILWLLCRSSQGKGVNAFLVGSVLLLINTLVIIGIICWASFSTDWYLGLGQAMLIMFVCIPLQYIISIVSSLASHFLSKRKVLLNNE